MNYFDRVQNILNKMKKAHDKGRGIRLSYKDLETLHITAIGEMWEEKDPRKGDLKSIKYKGKIYEGKPEEIMHQLREQERLPLSKIGRLFGVERQRVSQILGVVGELEFPELGDPNTFTEPDEVVAFRLNVSTSKVARARRALGIKAPVKVNIKMRRKQLSKYLFDKDPGPEFVAFISKQLEKLTTGRARVLEEFYVSGISSSPADNVNSDTDKVYRVDAKRQLKDFVKNYDIEWLIKEGVLNE